MVNLLSIDVARQTLECLVADTGICHTSDPFVLRRYASQAVRRGTVFDISTAANGLGERNGSYQTPQGWHYIRARIGRNLPANAVLSGRRWTGEIFQPDLAARFPGRDWILSRILWLCGLEPGHNRGKGIDTQQRYIYIHGTAEEHLLGTAVSHGCIRMANQDVMVLSEIIQPGCRVIIR